MNLIGTYFEGNERIVDKLGHIVVNFLNHVVGQHPEEKRSELVGHVSACAVVHGLQLSVASPQFNLDSVKVYQRRVSSGHSEGAVLERQDSLES